MMSNMNRLDIETYRRINKSFTRKMVYHVGVDSGFFVEMNYMINAMLYCLSKDIQFQLYLLLCSLYLYKQPHHLA
mgnify:CR=1 FL=1